MMAGAFVALLLGTAPVLVNGDAPAAENFGALMSGADEVPGPGDPDGSGVAAIAIEPATSKLCYQVAAKQIAVATAVHIHKGAAGSAGPPVVTLKPPVEGTVSDCLQIDPAVAAAIMAAPEQYYVNIHNAEHPAGAVRGQLQ
jgi:hypothetical protein